MVNQFPDSLAPSEEDIQRLLATQAHIGTTRLEAPMERYVYTRRTDGVHLINLRKTWEKLQLAARVIVTIENPADVVVISSKPHGQRAVLKFARYTGAHAIAGRYTPGLFTNQIQERFLEPRLLVVTDPRADHQPIKESSYVNIPTIAFAHTDSPVNYVDIVIPCNNKGKQAIGLMWWLLCREVNYLRNSIARGSPWDVMVDLFLFREPEEQQEQEKAQENLAIAAAGGDNSDEPQIYGAFNSEDWAASASGEQWADAAASSGTNWDAPVSGQSWEADAAAAAPQQ